MAHEKTRAIVLRAIDYSETSQVLALCTESSGLVHAIAKGSRRGAMKGVAAPDVLDCGEVVFVPKPPPQLSILTEWQALNNFRALRSDLDRLYAALYAVELVLATTDRAEDDAVIFRALLGLEQQLASAAEPAPAVVGFELALLEGLGLGPETARCVQCGAGLRGRVRFSPSAGGALCEDCYVPGTDAVATMAGTLASLAHMRRGHNGDASGRLRLTVAIRKDLRRLLDLYWDHILNRPPRMRRHISRLAHR